MIIAVYLSIALLSFSVLVHLITFFGVNIAGSFPLVWILQFGIFLLGIPLIFTKPFVENSRSRTGWHNLMLPVPEKYKQLLKWFPVYVALNFLVAVLLSVLTNGVVNENRGAWAQEFNLHIFSAFWIYFYLFFAIVLWYHRKRQEKINHKKLK